MSILDIRKEDNRYQYRKTILNYLLLSVFAAIVNKVYALFGHGVSSASMTYMFLYPLIFGGVGYLLLGLLFPRSNRLIGYRLFYILYNCGVATITIGSLLQGIMEIAGTDSPYLKLYYSTGYGMLGVGVLILVFMIIKMNKINGSNQ